MTAEKIDHYAEAKKIASPIEDGPFGTRIEFIQEALLHATLASIEEQRTANLIAYQANVEASYFQTLTKKRSGQANELNQTIIERLGLV